MRFRMHPSGGVELFDIPPFFMELLMEIPRVAARHEGAHARIYPDPLGHHDSDGAEDLRQDWREHVHPGLERLFASARDIVAADLAAIRPHGASAQCVIPRANFDAWLSALNQARFVIAGENDFTERDLSGADHPDPATRRGASLFAVHFYAHLQELLVEASD